ncbi:MAG: phenylalanine--tRNA ligase subunit alpha [Chitinivibrionales bacterium]|nr:phenylalanine--tRNA ligase subunit alpha [Chitinivibrionales bacterium]MBD3394320.1 phenylalanine--tRNA ligase subunit alpha [Chitinivibrionales bacterium]
MATPAEYRTPKQLDALEQSLRAEMGTLADDRAAEEFRIKYLGKKGLLRSLLKGLAGMPENERKAFGARANRLRADIEQEFKQAPWRSGGATAEHSSFDPTLPAAPLPIGSIHPSVQTCDEICDIFVRMGFDIAYGPDVETDYYNFEALNFPRHHPARDMQDTFFVSDSMLLRTHTSPVQIRVMEKQKPPIRCIMPGTVYRHEEISARSYCQFAQVEGLYIDRDVSMADLKGTLLAFSKQFFGENTKIKIRSSFFPFTEPSIEVDVWCFVCNGSGCSVCKQSGWLEILGAGMVHPNVLKAGGIDSEEYTGFAFGMGVERIALMRYGIDDIRLFFENDVRFLKQF